MNMKHIKESVFILFFVFLAVSLNAQIEKHVDWSFSSRNTGDSETELVITAKINQGWHVYSQFIKEGGPVPTSFKFNESKDYQFVGKVKELSQPIKKFETVFNMDVIYYAEKAVFIQKIKLNKPETVVKGSLEFMVCNDEQCLPPDEVEFSIPVKNTKATAGPEKQLLPVNSVPVEKTSTKTETKDPVSDPTDTTKISKTAQDKLTVGDKAGPNGGKKMSLWAIFLSGLLGGFAAFLMPCIFPMLPLTVSYFTKSGSKGNALGRSLIYAISIIIIYVALGLLVTILLGPDALNELSTNGIFNLLFFILLVVFAASFLGAFEITLPSGWINKADSKSESGGLVGIFFMAATLALVSFSCTGPIIGTLLVQAATMGQYMGPAVGMFGFALALSIPFALFAMFPSWISSLPKSGGWLNSVKVVLGFLELALALKFLSNVDLAYHWKWFDREIYLVLWITIFGLLGLYLLGKIKFPHDGEFKEVSVIRLFLAIIVLSFTVYMVPGLWGAPLRSIAAFLPPQSTQDFDLYTPGLNAGSTSTDQHTHKYSDIFQAPLNLNAFFDFDEGLAYAKKENKPVIIDFTGHACVNCRKMEADVWSTRNVLAYLNKEYVLIQLYVDDKTDLPGGEQYVSKLSGKKIKTIGNKWSDFQATHFNSNSQPFYVLLDTEGNLLVKPSGADYDPESYLSFLKTGLNTFKNKK
jgi:thiol:disulfide interchange protein